MINSKLQRIIVEYVNEYVNGSDEDTKLLLPQRDVNDERNINLDSTGVVLHHKDCEQPRDKNPDNGKWVQCQSWWTAVEYCLSTGRKFRSCKKDTCRG